VNKPQFLFVMPWELYQLGGVNQVVINLIHRMRQSPAYEPLILINSWDHVEPDHRDSEFGPTIYYRLRAPWNPRRPIKNLLGFLLDLPRVLSRLRSITAKAAVVNIHYPGLTAFAFALLKRTGLYRGKLLLSFHGIDLDEAKQTSGVSRGLWRFILRHTDHIVTCSIAIQRLFVAFEPGLGHKATAIHNGIDIDLLQRQRDSSYVLDPRLQAKPFLLCVATFEDNKGQDILVRAFSQVAPFHPDLDLVLIGRVDRDIEALKQLIRDLGLTDRVWLFENMPHNRIAAFMEKAILFVLPSRVEPFGIVILEAGAFCLPVVATTVGGILEILEQGTTGRLVPPEQPEALATEILALLRNATERKRLGENLHRHVTQHFTWRKAYDQYIALAQR
jgi:glycosyltransferase involved in cell wall biosynthesis